MFKIKIDLKKLWTFSVVLYIICSSAFSYGDLSMLNTYALYFFLGVSVINLLFEKNMKLDITAVSIILYAALSLVSLLYTPTPQSKAMNVLYKFITMAVIVVCMVQYIESLQDIKLIMTSYMLAGLALAIYVYSIYGNQFWKILQESAQNDADYTGRLGDELTNVNVIGMYTIISALIALYYVFYERQTMMKTIAYIAVMIFCFIVSMAAASRKSVIVLLVAFFSFWLYGSIGTPNIMKQLRNLVVLIAAIAGLLYVINTIPIFKSVSNRITLLFDFLSGEEGTVSEQNRYYYVQQGLSTWSDNVLLGEGFAASISHFGTYSHNNFIEILMNTGTIGFILFYFPYIVFGGRYLIKAKQYKQTDKISILLFALFLSISVCSAAMVYYYERYYMVLFAVIFSAAKFLGQKKTETGITLREENV